MKTCSDGCCTQGPTGIWRNGTNRVNYCPENGERLNSAGTVTPGVWGDNLGFLGLWHDDDEWGVDGFAPAGLMDALDETEIPRKLYEGVGNPEAIFVNLVVVPKPQEEEANDE